jgi:hypothetical protein
MTREEAIEELAKPIYDPAQYREDKSFVLKKLRLTEEEFAAIMSLPPRSHYEFEVDRPIEERLPWLMLLKRLYRMVLPVDAVRRKHAIE